MLRPNIQKKIMKGFTKTIQKQMIEVNKNEKT